MKTHRTILITGSILGTIAVVLGAFGAHGLKKMVDIESINSFNTGVRYQMYIAIICLFLGIINFISKKSLYRIFYLFISGTILFSGSIYLLVIDEIIGVSLSSIGFITPLGGFLIIIGWVSLLISFLKIK